MGFERLIGLTQAVVELCQLVALCLAFGIGAPQLAIQFFHALGTGHALLIAGAQLAVTLAQVLHDAGNQEGLEESG